VSTGDPGRLRRLNRDSRLVKGARLVRDWLPGDERYGDPMSTGGERPSEIAGRQLSELTSESPGVLRELGLGAVQVWQALSEAQGRGRGDAELTIVFTDLSGFSRLALEKGDTLAVNLLRDVGAALEPPLTDRGGTIVKRLGDGLMAVFADPQAAVDGVLEARDNVGAIEHDGYRPRIRAGIHLGRPRRLGADYLGVDVNVAARLVDAAAPGEVLGSDVLLSRIDPERVKTKRKRWFRAKGTPDGLQVFALTA
jgi:adenylate cyclase